MWQHMYKSGIAIVRSFTMHKPYVIFINLGLIFFLLGLVPFVRYAIIYIDGDRGQHIQSLILGAILIFASIVSLALGIIADLIRTNRILIEDTLERVKRVEIQKKDK
jgi:hypothetical protein